MDALVCSAPGELKVEQRPAPNSHHDHALVRPRRIGICGTDYHIFEGTHPYLKYPRVMGHELRGRGCRSPGRLGRVGGRCLRRQPISVLRALHRLSRGETKLLHDPLCTGSSPGWRHG